MIVASFYTLGTPYEQEAGALRETLERFSLRYDIRGLPHPGSWAAANALNAGFIRDVRRDHKGEAVLYLDADARVMQWPAGPCPWQEFDAAFYWLPDSPRSPDGTGWELCSGTSWWAPTPTADRILDLWVEANARPETLLLRGVDQEALQTLVLPQVPEARLYQLSAEWCWIADISVRHYGERDPVILHTQASRRLKNRVNWTPKVQG